MVIAIIAILAAILLPALNSARQRGKAASCINNLKQAQMGYINYSSDNNDYGPYCYWGAAFNRGFWESAIVAHGYLPSDRAQKLNQYDYYNSSLLLCPGLGKSITAGDKRSDYGLNFQSTQYKSGTVYIVTKVTAIPPGSVILADRWEHDNTATSPQVYFHYTVEYIRGLNGGSGSNYPVGIHHSGNVNVSFLDGHVSSISLEDACSNSDVYNKVLGTL